MALGRGGSGRFTSFPNPMSATHDVQHTGIFGLGMLGIQGQSVCTLGSGEVALDPSLHLGTLGTTSGMTLAEGNIGRRGGKSFVLAVIAVFLACFKDWRPYLGPGEIGTVMIIAKDRAQARSIKRYISGLPRTPDARFCA